jgi:hypothetical protein
MYKELRHCKKRSLAILWSNVRNTLTRPHPVTVIIASAGGFGLVSPQVSVSALSFVASVGVRHMVSYRHTIWVSRAGTLG